MEKPLITQEVIDAYDEYTHLTLDRRRFMETLTRLAGSGAAAAAIASLIAANSAKAAVVAADDPRVKAQDITYPGASGAPASGKPFGPGEFGPNPSGSGSTDAPHRPAPKPSTLARIASGRTVQSDRILL